MKNDYIQAVTELLKDEKDIEAIFRGLKRILKARGHLRLYSSILSGVLKDASRESSDTVVTVAKAETFKSDTEDIKGALDILGADATFSEVIDATLIGGYVVKHNYMMLDKSYKTKLTNLYRRVTK